VAVGLLHHVQTTSYRPPLTRICLCGHIVWCNAKGVGDREILETYSNSASKNTSETDIFPHGSKSLLTSVISHFYKHVESFNVNTFGTVPLFVRKQDYLYEGPKNETCQKRSCKQWADIRLWAIMVFNSTRSSIYTRLQVIQSKSLRVIGNHPRRTPTSHLHYTLNIQPIPFIIHRLTAKIFLTAPHTPTP